MIPSLRLSLKTFLSYLDIICNLMMNWNVQTRNEEGFLCGSCAPHYLIYDLRVRREMVFR